MNLITHHWTLVFSEAEFDVNLNGLIILYFYQSCRLYNIWICYLNYLQWHWKSNLLDTCTCIPFNIGWLVILLHLLLAVMRTWVKGHEFAICRRFNFVPRPMIILSFKWGRGRGKPSFLPGNLLRTTFFSCIQTS